jgi:hypothetical protein
MLFTNIQLDDFSPIMDSVRCCLSTTVESLGSHMTDMQKASIIQLRNSLYHKINTWRCAQVLYLPVVQDLINQTAHNVQENAECMKLWLPSQLRGKPCDMHLLLQEHPWPLFIFLLILAFYLYPEDYTCIHMHYLFWLVILSPYLFWLYSL